MIELLFSRKRLIGKQISSSSGKYNSSLPACPAAEFVLTAFASSTGVVRTCDIWAGLYSWYLHLLEVCCALNEQFSPSWGQNQRWKWSGAGLVLMLVLGGRDGARLEEGAPPGMLSEAVGAP